MKNKKLERWLLQIFATKIGWLGISLLGMITFGALSNVYEWAEIGLYISLIWPVVFTLIAIAYAWVINPIREYKENKKFKEQNKK
jgi:ABC-type uncharacterized transport system permease subunit